MSKEDRMNLEEITPFRQSLIDMIEDPGMDGVRHSGGFTSSYAEPGNVSPGSGPGETSLDNSHRDVTNPSGTRGNDAPHDAFLPLLPGSFSELGLRSNDITPLILKFLLTCGTQTGKEIARQIRLPLGIIGGLLRELKEERLLVYKAAAPAGDYLYDLTEAGCERGRRYWEQHTYFGSAPVPLSDYIAGVLAQSVRKQSPTLRDLQRALRDLSVKKAMLIQLAQAVHSGLGLFLYGAPGNGKTSLAHRITRAFGQAIWIPRAISVEGNIIRIYDPNNHEPLPLSPEEEIHAGRIDDRWIRIRRPTILVGGELTMDNLEIGINQATGVSEAPLQLKSNCGTLVIDDFGRQRISPAELLNRWILPLEQRRDILTLANGRKIEVPFDQLIVFSTNLEPRELVDEAFLRRIPYKIEVTDPSEDEFRNLIQQLASTMGIQHDDTPINHLIENYYSKHRRMMRYCHPRDIMQQVRTYCTVLDLPMVITKEAIDAAAKNYFALH